MSKSLAVPISATGEERARGGRSLRPAVERSCNVLSCMATAVNVDVPATAVTLQWVQVVQTVSAPWEHVIVATGRPREMRCALLTVINRSLAPSSGAMRRESSAFTAGGGITLAGVTAPAPRAVAAPPEAPLRPCVVAVPDAGPAVVPSLRGRAPAPPVDTAPLPPSNDSNPTVVNPK